MTDETPIPNFEAAVLILGTGAAEFIGISSYRLDQLRREWGWTDEQLRDHLTELCRRYRLRVEYNDPQQTWEFTKDES